jgi:drug/metabolite transporter (DMT)-like permease
MEPLVFGLVAVAAVLHAVWNALVKVHGDRLVAITLVNASGGLMALALAPFVPFPDPESWPFLIGSALVHLFYYGFLVLSYRHGDLSQVYPIARGVAPMLVAVGAFVFAGERLAPLGIVAVAMISIGILSLALGRAAGRQRGSSVLFALFTGLMIASYTVLDGLGGRATTQVLGYIVWLFILDTFPLLGVTLILRRGRFLASVRAGWKPAVLGGVLAATAYGLVIWAMSLTPMTYVSALRETSVIVAALIGIHMLKEPMGLRRVSAAAVVAMGVVLLQVAHVGLSN